ncbi:MAG: hypothetical protein ACTSO9_10045 [Candidatus Helarchaeota archaeon]
MVVLLNDIIWFYGFILFIGFISVLIIFSIYFIQRAHRNSTERGSRDIYGYCIGFFYLIIGFGYLIRIYFMFIIPDQITFILNLTTSWRIDPQIRLFWQLHMVIVFVGISALMIGVETQVYTKFHYIISAITLIVAPLIIILPYDVAHMIYLIPMGTPIIIIIIYLYVGIQNPGSIRRNSFAIVIGWAVFILGITLNSTTVRQVFFPESYPVHPYVKMLFFYEQLGIPGLLVYISSIFASESAAIIPAIIAPISLLTGFLIQAAGYSRKFD